MSGTTIRIFLTDVELERAQVWRGSWPSVRVP